MPVRKEKLNMLLLGESGVGKSTFINSFINYLSYASIQEAQVSPELYLIPASFTYTDDDYVSHKIVTGKQDDNEVHVTGQSATQECRTYRFELENHTINIIDTPGIADVRGIQQDEHNLELILSYLEANFESIDGICILLKPDTHRLSVNFRFCVKGLLCQLHKDAKDNIAFCFTNSRSTLYKPGETLPSLRVLLEDVKMKSGIIVPCDKHNIFCFDNESFRFLCMIRHQKEFDQGQINDFEHSWDHSVKETCKLFKFINKCNPHNVKDTVSMNACRRLISRLARPISEITQSIQVNLHLIADQQLKIESSKQNLEQLKTELFVPYEDLQAMELNYPRTVCTSDSCVTIVNKKVEYNQHCHAHCYLSGVATETVNNPDIKNCWAMVGEDCRECGCNWYLIINIGQSTSILLMRRNASLRRRRIRALLLR